MSQLIAMVATAVLINGVRTIIQPGEELPELSKHDAQELTASGAAENQDDKAAQAKAATTAAKKADAEFVAARKRVRQEQDSIPKPEAEKVAPSQPVVPAAEK